MHGDPELQRTWTRTEKGMHDRRSATEVSREQPND